MPVHDNYMIVPTMFWSSIVFVYYLNTLNSTRLHVGSDGVRQLNWAHEARIIFFKNQYQSQSQIVPLNSGNGLIHPRVRSGLRRRLELISLLPGLPLGVLFLMEHLPICLFSPCHLEALWHPLLLQLLLNLEQTTSLPFHKTYMFSLSKMFASYHSVVSLIKPWHVQKWHVKCSFKDMRPVV